MGAACDGGAAGFHRTYSRRLPVPVLVVVGEQDAITPPAVARAMVEAVETGGGTVDYAELPGAGHLTPAEDPDGFVAAVLGWWRPRF